MKRYNYNQESSMMVEAFNGAWVRWEDVKQAEAERDAARQDLLFTMEREENAKEALARIADSKRVKELENYPFWHISEVITEMIRLRDLARDALDQLEKTEEKWLEN